MNKYFKKIGSTESISEWKSKGLSDEIIKPPTTSYTRGTIVNIYIVYKLSSNLINFGFTLKKLFVWCS